MPLPALLTIQSGINQLRYATLKGIMAAKKKEIRKVALPAGLAAVAADRRAGAAGRAQADADDRRVAGRGREGAGAPAARGGAGAVILVIAEQRDGKLNRATWEAIAAAQQLAAGDEPLTVAVPRRGRRRRGAGAGGRRGRRRARGDRPGARAVHARTATSWRLSQVIASASPQVVLLAAHLPDARLRADAGRAAATSRSSPT